MSSSGRRAQRSRSATRRSPTEGTCALLVVKDRLSRLFSAQQETVQRSPGWDWIFTFVVAEMRASGCSMLLS